MRPLVLALVAAGALALAGGCAGGEQAPPAEVVGVVAEVEGGGGRVTAFTLDAEGGETYEIFIAEDVDYGFDLDHLREHEATGEPVRCRLEQRGERLYALSILDA